MQNPIPDIHAIDDRKIGIIRDQLAADTYIVNPQQIATRIIDLEIAFCRPHVADIRTIYHA